MSCNNTRRFQWVAILILLLACSVSQGAQAQDSDPALTPREQAHIAEIRHLLASAAGDVWPGWEAHIPPLLLRKGAFDYLIGHPDPPPEFIAVPGLIIENEPVLRREGHLLPVPAATSWQVGDVWSAATPVQDEFQQAIDEAVGEGVIVLDDVAFIRAVVHEAFHAYQMTQTGGMDHMPEFVLQSGDFTLLDTLSASEQAAFDAALSEEGQALAAALAPDASDAAIRAAAAEFLELRAVRRAALPASIAAAERGIEWIEGAARYADTRLMLEAGNPDYTPSAAITLVYPKAGDVWEDFSAQLADLSTMPGSRRDWYSAMGAGQLFVLDRLLPGWQGRLLNEGIAAEDLLAEALESH